MAIFRLKAAARELPPARRRSFAIMAGGSVEEARRDLAAWIGKWGSRYPRLVAWAEETIEETLTFYRLLRQHHKHLKSTNMIERLNEESRRRISVMRIVPTSAACCRLVRVLTVETHENWLEAHRYLNMDELKEHKKPSSANRLTQAFAELDAHNQVSDFWYLAERSGLRCSVTSRLTPMGK